MLSFILAVGAGSAGAALATRLSEDLDTSVLLLEAGQSEDFMTEIPSFNIYVQRGTQDWHFESTPQKYSFGAVSDRQLPIPRGRVLGGSSTLNYMIWARGNRQDYDSWDKVVGGDGLWSFEQVFPYFIRIEDFRVPGVTNNGWHGRGGPISVQFYKQITPIVEAFLAAGREFGYPTADYTAGDEATFFPTLSNLRDGFRCSTSKGYLRGIDGQNRNLDIILGALVTKVIIDKNNRAVGVMFDRDESSHTVYARKKIILSAGAIGTPHLLMLSGIGDCNHLDSVGITCRVNLPAVGQNLQDHLTCYGNNWLLDNAPIRPPPTSFINPYQYWQLFRYGQGSLILSTDVDGIAFFRTKYANKSMPPDMQIQYSSYTLASDGGIAAYNAFNVRPDVIARMYIPFFGREAFMFPTLLMNPKSRGTVKLRDSSPYSKPLIDFNFLSDPQDVRALIEGNRIVRAMAFTDGFRRLGVRDYPKIVGCEHLEFDSDQYHECVVRTVTFTDFHPVGTCAMGSCVDKKLRVKGVKNLRVADASVMPTITTGNTNAPSIMIGEKLADILQDKKWYNTVGHKLKPGQVFPGEPRKQWESYKWIVFAFDISLHPRHEIWTEQAFLWPEDICVTL